MSDANIKWYLAAGKDGKDGKIITNSEALALSPSQRVGHLYTLSAALRDGIIGTDPSEHDDINKLTFWTRDEHVDLQTGEIKYGPKKFLTNQLRDKIKEVKQKLSGEDSLKAKIAAAKAAKKA